MIGFFFKVSALPYLPTDFPTSAASNIGIMYGVIHEEKEPMPQTETHTDQLSWRNAVGFACLLAFMYDVFYMGSNVILPVGTIGIERADMLAMLLGACLALIVFVENRKLRSVSTDVTANAVAGIVMAVAYAATVLFSNNTPLLLATDAVIGVGLAVGLTGWASRLASASPRLAADEVFLATGVAAALCFGTLCLPEGVARFVPIALPLVSFVLMVPARSAAVPTDMQEREDFSATMSTRIGAGIFFYGVSAGLMETFRANPDGPAAPLFAATAVILLLFCWAVLQSIWSDKPAERDAFGGMYRIALLVIMTGFLFQPVMTQSGVPGDTLVLAGFLGLCSCFVALFLATATVSGLDAPVLIARCFMAVFGGELAGIVIGNMFNTQNGTAITPYVAMATAGLFALIAYLFLFTDRSFGEMAVVVDDLDYADEARRRIIERSGLSARESEVFVLALRGHTNERIAQELYLAKSTVDTHLRRIYGKCGVHSRQELIDLAESEEQSLRTTTSR